MQPTFFAPSYLQGNILLKTVVAYLVRLELFLNTLWEAVLLKQAALLKVPHSDSA